MVYCKNMLESVKIYTSDKFWPQILTDLGAVLVDNPNLADVNFDNVDLDSPVSVVELKNIILNCCEHTDIIVKVFGEYVVLPRLQHKIVVLLYKNPNINMADLKTALGVSPDLTTHAVETAIYQLRKKYGHNSILNQDGKYSIGRI